MEIDAVYTWVNMNDPEWISKYKKVAKKNPEMNRYKDYGELEFSVKLLIRNCDFIKNIYIVTDNQIPSWYNQIKYPNVRIIDHQQILGPECHNPTFKSDAIESYLHRIPNLSEFYLYLNDDVFIGNKCSIYHFIDKNTHLPIARFKYCELNNSLKQRLLFGMSSFARGISLVNAVNCIKKKYSKHYNLSPIHQAVILRKSMGELAWKLFPKELTESVKRPFRKPKNDTISFTLLSMLLGITLKKMKPEIDTYSIKIYQNYSLSNGGAERNLKNIIRMKPQLFCINDINDFNYIHFKKFKENYIQINLNKT